MKPLFLEHHSDSSYSFPIDEHTLRICLKAKKGYAPKKVEVLYNVKYLFHEYTLSKEMGEVLEGSEDLYYLTNLHLDDPRFAYVFYVEDEEGNHYYFSEYGLSKEYPLKESFYSFFQIPFLNSSDMVQENPLFKGRLFYQIFVDRFCRSKDNNNPRINMKWGDKVTPTSIAGGDLKGIEEKIPYLKSLGVGAIYLTPIQESLSNHKYDIIDYEHVAKDFGNDADLAFLIRKCHENDILVVLDTVYNHLSYQNALFQDVLQKGRESKYADFFYFEGDKPLLAQKNYYTFAYCNYMPKINLNSFKTQDYFIALTLSLLKKFDMDGLRLDVSDEVPHSFWRRLHFALKKEKPYFYLCGENWHEATSYLEKGDEFDAVMNYGIMKAFLDVYREETRNAKEFVERLTDLRMRYKEPVIKNNMNFLDSHDTYRFYTEVKKDKRKFLASYAFLFFYEGLPSLYYGDEVGLEGGYDPDSRRCFPWKEKLQDQEIKEAMLCLLAIRKEYYCASSSCKLYAEGDLVHLERAGKKKELHLTISFSSHPLPYQRKGKLLFSFSLENTQLLPYGLALELKEVNS